EMARIKVLHEELDPVRAQLLHFRPYRLFQHHISGQVFPFSENHQDPLGPGILAVRRILGRAACHPEKDHCEDHEESRSGLSGSQQKNMSCATQSVAPDYPPDLRFQAKPAITLRDETASSHPSWTHLRHRVAVWLLPIPRAIPKYRRPAEGFLCETMVHRISGALGVLENVTRPGAARPAEHVETHGRHVQENGLGLLVCGVRTSAPWGRRRQ